MNKKSECFNKTEIGKMYAIRFLTIFVLFDLKSSARKMTLRFFI